jgi:predicted PurR-regulated permease PerM
MKPPVRARADDAARRATVAAPAPAALGAAAAPGPRAAAAAPEALAAATAPAATGLAVVVIAVLGAIAAARVAQPFLMPVVTGLLLRYSLEPLVARLAALRVPRIAGAALVVALLVALLSATGYAVRDEAADFVAQLPSAARKLGHAATEFARRPAGPVSQLKETAAELDRAAAAAAGKPPVAVPSAPGVGSALQELVAVQSGLALAVASQAAVALLFAFFLLAAGDTFRRKLVRLAGASLARRRVTLEVLAEIDHQVQRYMLTLLVSNALIGFATWGALALLAVPNAGFWGVVTGILHVIPYAGTLVALGGVGVAAFVAGGSLGDAALALAAVAAIATGVGMGLAPWLQGRATRMNPVAVFVGILFFGWLWGGWGLLLGVPILAVLKTIADRVAALAPAAELLGT